MDINILKILVDFGLVVLAWIVQLAIYPSFMYYNEKDLKKWHPVYTKRITYVVLPLMLTQLVIHSWLLYSFHDFSHILLWILVMATWMITFIFAVPLHHRIDRQDQAVESCKKLLLVNAARVVLWSAIFVLDLLLII